MSRRATNLLEEMQTIFGSEFGAGRESLTESVDELGEARGRGMQRGARSGKQSREKQADGDRRSARSIQDIARRTAGKSNDKSNSDAEGKLAKFRAVRDKAPAKEPEKASAGKAASKASAGAASSGSGERHFPFKRSSDLGPGPREQKLKQTKCWKCKCAGIYSSGCTCVAVGKGENCPTGSKKKLKYNKGYKTKYNKDYRQWRADKFHSRSK